MEPVLFLIIKYYILGIIGSLSPHNIAFMISVNVGFNVAKSKGSLTRLE